MRKSRLAPQERKHIVKAKSRVSLIDKDRAGYPRNANSIYKIFFLCELVGGVPTVSIESSGVEFFDIHALPPLDPHRARKEDILQALSLIHI